MPFKLSQHLLNSYLARSRSLQKRAGLEPPQSEQPSWCIVNVSSLLAEKGGKGSATYAATKAALTALTRVLALESGDLSERSQAVMPPLRVNAILPGYIETPMIEGMPCHVFSHRLNARDNSQEFSGRRARSQADFCSFRRVLRSSKGRADGANPSTKVWEAHRSGRRHHVPPSQRVCQ